MICIMQVGFRLEIKTPADLNRPEWRTLAGSYWNLRIWDPLSLRPADIQTFHSWFLTMKNRGIRGFSWDFMEMAGRFEDATSSERVVDPLAWSWGKSPLGDHGPPIPWRTRMTSRPRLEGSPHSRRHRARAAPEVSEKTYGWDSG